MKNNKLTIELDTTQIKSKLQMNVLQSLIKDGSYTEAMEYIKTFSARGRRSVSHEARGIKHNLKSFNSDRLIDKGSNSVFKKFKMLFETKKTHVPNSETAYAGEYIGVEIECFVPKNEDFECNCDRDSDDCNCDRDNDSILSDMREYVLANRIKGVCFKGDGSINCDDEYQALEVCVLTKIGDMSNLEAVCKMLSHFKAEVNKSCGLHVHLDMRDAKALGRDAGQTLVTRRARNITNAMDLMVSMQPQSRRSNTYCKLGSSKFRGDRYYAVNKTAYGKYNTLEVRLHSSTTNYEKIQNWVKLVYMLSRKNNNKKVKNLGDLMNLFPELSDEYITYLEGRIRTFSPELYAGTGSVSLDSEDQTLHDESMRQLEREARGSQAAAARLTAIGLASQQTFQNVMVHGTAVVRLDIESSGTVTTTQIPF